MVDIVTTASTIIFIAILLAIGVVVFGTIANPMGDQRHSNEILVAAGCSNDNASTEATLCSGIVDNPPIENVTRDAPVLTNCTTSGTSCQAMTAGTNYNYSKKDGTFWVSTGDESEDQYNGTIYITYWEDTVDDTPDLAQQSITSTAYGGFDLATVMVIVMAAVGIVSTIFLIGRRGA